MTPPRQIVAVVEAGSAEDVGHQTHALTQVHAGRGALYRGVGSGADWLWLLGRGARARDDALEHLVVGIEKAGRRKPALAAGVALDETGSVLASKLGAGAATDVAEVIRIVQLRMLPLRHTPLTNCLVARDMFERHGLPDARRFGPFAPIEWTARVLREEAGYLVPASVVVLPAPPARANRLAALSALPAAVRMSRSGAWTHGETARAVVRLVEGRANHT